MKNQKRIKIGYKIYTLENGLLVESERVQGHKPFNTLEQAIMQLWVKAQRECY